MTSRCDDATLSNSAAAGGETFLGGRIPPPYPRPNSDRTQTKRHESESTLPFMRPPTARGRR
jgi:hypothetical protein